MANRFAIVVLLNVMSIPSLAVSLPEYQCRRLPDKRFGCDLPDHIQAEMSEPTCHAQWSINNVSVVVYESGSIQFVLPVIAATLEAVTLETFQAPLVFDISCSKSSFIKQLLFSCPSDDTLLPPKATSAGVSLFIAPFLLLTTGITIIVC